MAMIQLDLFNPVVCKIINGNSNAESFIEFLKDCCTNGHLRPGDTVVLDNASIHRARSIQAELQQLQQTYGFTLRFLPAYSPELNPIENVFGHLKNWLREHLRDETPIIVGLIFALLTIDLQMMLNFFKHGMLGPLLGTNV
jgi:transposase